MSSDADIPPCQLYLISPPQFDLSMFTGQLDDALGAGGVACVQLRLKEAADAAILKAADALMPICADHDVAFVMNDRADLAQMVGADAVHLGQSDGLVSDARDLLGFDTAIGVTCHGSQHLAMLAGEQGADYVAFGAFFPSVTKDPPAMAEISLLRWWSALAELPSVAIGGITPENCAPIVAAGADMIAASHAIWAHADGPAAAVAQFNDAIAAALSGKQPINLADELS
ncbi:MAG: thiamine phosphate synthase [Pseudomonadota bacterium]